MIGKTTFAKINPFQKHYFNLKELSSGATRVSLETPQDIADFSTKKAPKKGILDRVKGFFSNIREAAAKKAAQTAEATRTKKMLDSDLGQLLRKKTYQRDWGTSFYGGTSTERLYSDKSIVAICEMKETNPKKAMSLMDVLREDRPSIAFAEAAKVKETDPETFAILSKVGKVNETQFTALASAKHIDPNVADGLSVSSIRTLDAAAGQGKESLDAVNKIMQNETLRSVLSKDVNANDLNKYVENMTEDPELTTRFTKKFEYEMLHGDERVKSIQKVNSLIATYKTDPGRMGAYIDGYSINEPKTLVTLYHQDKKGWPVMQLLEERSHGCTITNAAEYVHFRTDKNNSVLLENILKTENKADKANNVEAIMRFVKGAEDKGIDTESIMSRMAEDERKPKSVQDFRNVFNIYASYPGEKISTEFIDYYTKNQELAPHIDLMSAFKG